MSRILIVDDEAGIRRSLAGIHLPIDYLEGANRVVAGDLSEPPITAAGKHVIVLGGGDTAADCLGTAHRHGAASVHLIEVMPEPPAARRKRLRVFLA